jgi:hypothetical protein
MCGGRRFDLALWRGAARAAHGDAGMRTADIKLRLPEEMRDAAVAQAAASGVSLNLFIATAVAARLRAQAEVARGFAARGARTSVARAKALLERIGVEGVVRDNDRVGGGED